MSDKAIHGRDDNTQDGLAVTASTLETQASKRGLDVKAYDTDQLIVDLTTAVTDQFDQFTPTTPLEVENWITGTPLTVATDDSGSIAGSGSDTYDYTVPAGKTLYLTGFTVSSANTLKTEMQIEDASFTSQHVEFAPANSGVTKTYEVGIKTVAAGKRLRFINTNRGVTAASMYTSIDGVLK